MYILTWQIAHTERTCLPRRHRQPNCRPTGGDHGGHPCGECCRWAWESRPLRDGKAASGVRHGPHVSGGRRGRGIPHAFFFPSAVRRNIAKVVSAHTNAADLQAGAGQGAESGLGTGSRGLGAVATSGPQLHVQSSDSELLQVDEYVLSAHGSCPQLQRQQPPTPNAYATTGALDERTGGTANRRRGS